MPSRDVIIASKVGLHARPASRFVKQASGLDVRVTIQKEDSAPVDARSMLSVMALGAKHGDKVTLVAEGEGADAALDQLVALLEQDLDA